MWKNICTFIGRCLAAMKNSKNLAMVGSAYYKMYFFMCNYFPIRPNFT